MSSPNELPPEASPVGVRVTPIQGGHVLVSVRAAAPTEATVAAFEGAVNAPGGDVVVDVAGVGSCDDALAGALMRSRDALADHGRRLVLVNVGHAFRSQLAAFASGMA